MNRSLPRRPELLLVAALSLGLVGCGQGLGPGLDPASVERTATVDPTDGVVQTVEEVTKVPTPPLPPPSEEPTPAPSTEPTPAMPEVVARSATPGPATLTVLPPGGRPAPEDCISYDPASLAVVASGDAWLLRSGNLALKRFDTSADAEDARRVARHWRKLCFIGRGSTGPDRYRHIINYFKQPSGLPVGLAPATIDCITYNPDDLDLYEGPSHPAEPDHDYWRLYSGSIPLLELDNWSDALRAQIVAAGYTRLCFIGAGNDRPDPYQFQMEWWRA